MSCIGTNEILAVTGMTGVGKDFLVEQANQTYGLEAINLGTLISQKLAIDRDLMMDTADPHQIRTAQMSAYHEVVAKQPLIVTCHAIRWQVNGYGYDLEMEQIFNPGCYVFVTAPGEIIAQRVRQRNEKGERKSPELPPDEIEHIQQLKLSGVEELAGILGCRMVIITNTDENIAHSTRLLGTQIYSLSRKR